MQDSRLFFALKIFSNNLRASVHRTVEDWLKACQAFGVLGVLAMAASLFGAAMLIFTESQQEKYTILALSGAGAGG